jgi:hypothetical protein
MNPQGYTDRNLFESAPRTGICIDLSCTCGARRLKIGYAAEGTGAPYQPCGFRTTTVARAYRRLGRG